jgi:hypothetical protein
MLAQLTWPIVFVCFPAESQTLCPLDPDRNDSSIDQSRKAGLIAFPAGRANGDDPRLRHYAAKCPPYLSFCTNADKHSQPLVFDSIRMSRATSNSLLGLDRALRGAHAPGPATCAACLCVTGWVLLW